MLEEPLWLQFLGDFMVQTSLKNPGNTGLFSWINSINPFANKNSASGRSRGVSTPAQTTTSSSGSKFEGRANAVVAAAPASQGSSQGSGEGGTGGETGDGSSGGTGDGSNGGSDGSSDGNSDGSESSEGSGTVSPLLEGSMTFEEMVGDICKGIDLIFAVKRSTVVITDYEGIYAEAKYLRDKNSKVVKGEDISLHQLEEGTYELDVSEYGFYNTVKVHYKNGTVTESYEDLVRVYGQVVIEYNEKKLDKTSAIMKAKAYLAAHVRDFDMATKANILWDGDIDIGDIVTIENPMTMRDKIRVNTEKRDPEYFFVLGKSVEWEGDLPITGTLDLRYGAVSPETKEVPESGTSYSNSSNSSNSNASSGDIQKAIDEVGKMAEGISYSGACQTHDCVQSKKTGDCWGMSDYIACELKSRGVETQIKQYDSGYTGNHRSVLYKDSTGQWQDFPYRKYAINELFRNTSNSKSGSNVKSTC